MNARRNSAATVLVVDDQEILTVLMCKTLEGSGFRVLAANNGADALTLCHRAEPPVDLLVTDYRMPDMTGLELARKCCGFDGELSVLYISGSSPGDTCGRTWKLGDALFWPSRSGRPTSCAALKRYWPWSRWQLGRGKLAGRELSD